MNGTKAKRIIIEYGQPKFLELGFDLKKTRDTETLFIRSLENGFERIGISTNNYNPEVQVVFGLGKRINSVEVILRELSKTVEVDERFLKKDAKTFNILEKKNLRMDLPYTETEVGIKQSVDMILDYMNSYAIPLFDKFNDLREINLLINGEGDNFWENDTGNNRPFNLAHEWRCRRLIIGRLAFDDIQFKELALRVQNSWNKRCEANGWALGSGTKVGRKIDSTIKYLLEHVECKY